MDRPVADNGFPPWPSAKVELKSYTTVPAPAVTRTALEWEQEYDRLYPGVTNPHRNAALIRAGDVMEALGSAQSRAEAALREGRIRYRGSLGFTELNLLEMWLWYAALTRMRPQPDVLAGARKYLRLQIKIHRAFLAQERRGIVGRLDGAAAA